MYDKTMNTKNILSAFLGNTENKDKKYTGIIIAGATATGKSSLAESVADKLGKMSQNSMIINSDSIQFYQALQKLTAQPENLQNHYLYNFLHPAIDYNATKWLKDLKIILDSNPESVPVIVGGTGLYISALLNGLVNLPARRENNPWRDRSFEECKVALEKIDSSALLILKDKRRMERFLDIYDQTGLTYTQLQAQEKIRTVEGNWLKIYVQRENNQDLIMKRLVENFDDYVEEVQIQQKLVDGTKMETAIGYREIKAMLENKTKIPSKPTENILRQQTIEKIFNKTCQYAKRQRTWFKKYYHADITV